MNTQIQELLSVGNAADCRTQELLGREGHANCSLYRQGFTMFNTGTRRCFTLGTTRGDSVNVTFTQVTW